MGEENTTPGFKYELCTACNECVEICPEQALEMRAGLPQLRADVTCTYCGLCEDHCPTGVIYLSYEILFGD